MKSTEFLKELNNPKTIEELLYFEKLCDRAKLLLFDAMLNDNINNDFVIRYSFYNNSLSPIEQIFNIAYQVYMDCMKLPNYDDSQFPLSAIFCESISAQETIVFNNKKYIADFVIDIDKCFDDNIFKGLKYVIELDGKNYHFSSKQINYDYERENDLKELGYNVIRFTGSQIYNEPYTCIDKLVSIILKDIKRKCEE